ncbi:hypothetical protein HO173_010436 [Letharia columbiana]|uniref:Uncharacterized protein n=1 Tax=Letharia columbiana TaxID=112416 RepID=A0A8H6FML8_9LECA|nr:uncharacterized protein HO173_010436 [Letharia columbiana]KAF6231293.1 hypothetical protein HO173_010436 [Letharia columbiana]
MGRGDPYYHSVAANPSFAGHGTWVSLTAPADKQEVSSPTITMASDCDLGI